MGTVGARGRPVLETAFAEVSVMFRTYSKTCTFILFHFFCQSSYFSVDF